MIKLNPNNSNCSNCSTTNCFIKKHCSEEYIKLINDKKQCSVYRKNQYIVTEGNPVLGLYFIQNGKVKIVSAGIENKEQVVRLTKNSDIIGHRGYGGEKYPISAIPLEDSTICFIDNQTIYDIFINTPNLTYELMMYYSKELRKSESKIKMLAQMNVREKVAYSLLTCQAAYNNTKKIALSRKDLASITGINTEQLSRVLSEFKKENMISIAKNEITINNPTLLSKIIKPFGIIEY